MCRSDKLKLPYRDELVQKAIDCLRGGGGGGGGDEEAATKKGSTSGGGGGWSVREKQSAISASLALIKCRPHVNPETRCSLLMACLSSVLPHLTDEEEVSEENVSEKADAMELMLTLMEEVVRQDTRQAIFDETFAILVQHYAVSVVVVTLASLR